MRAWNGWERGWLFFIQNLLNVNVNSTVVLSIYQQSQQMMNVCLGLKQLRAFRVMTDSQCGYSKKRWIIRCKSSFWQVWWKEWMECFSGRKFLSPHSNSFEVGSNRIDEEFASGFAWFHSERWSRMLEKRSIGVHFIHWSMRQDGDAHHHYCLGIVSSTKTSLFSMVFRNFFIQHFNFPSPSFQFSNIPSFQSQDMLSRVWKLFNTRLMRGRSPRLESWMDVERCTYPNKLLPHILFSPPFFTSKPYV